MGRVTRFVTIAAIAGALGFALGWTMANNRNETLLNRVVAFSWGDGKHGKGFYGAQVYLDGDPDSFGYLVRARVHLGRGNDYFHDCGILGKAHAPEDAVEQWGKIEWREDGLHIGNGTNHFFLPR